MSRLKDFINFILALILFAVLLFVFVVIVLGEKTSRFIKMVGANIFLTREQIRFLKQETSFFNECIMTRKKELGVREDLDYTPMEFYKYISEIIEERENKCREQGISNWFTSGYIYPPPFAEFL